MPLNFKVSKDAKSGNVSLYGMLDIYHMVQARKLLEKNFANNNKSSIDISNLTTLDTAGALLLRQISEKYSAKIINIQSDNEKLFNLIKNIETPNIKNTKKQAIWRRVLICIGSNSVSVYKETISFIAFLGEACVVLSKSILSWKHLRIRDVTHHIESAGINAIPIISVMAFMISIVLTYQGVAQLKPLGFESLTVNLVAVSVLREMGVLLTSIMIAGRSGSAFAAEIGVMKIREEVDALKVTGINPVEVLVLPRIIALLIALPLLTFIADIVGLLGGGVMSMILTDTPLVVYMDKVHMVISGNDFLVGMIKAPVFALLISLSACMHGMKVSGSSESVGKETTKAVVRGIFLVIVADALFSILFEKIGI